MSGPWEAIATTTQSESAVGNVTICKSGPVKKIVTFHYSEPNLR